MKESRGEEVNGEKVRKSGIEDMRTRVEVMGSRAEKLRSQEMRSQEDEETRS